MTPSDSSVQNRLLKNDTFKLEQRPQNDGTTDTNAISMQKLHYALQAIHMVALRTAVVRRPTDTYRSTYDDRLTPTVVRTIFDNMTTKQRALYPEQTAVTFDGVMN